MPKEISAGAIIFRKEKDSRKYLLLHYEEGHWDFAKGHIEKGEDENTTVRREVEEETGITQIEFIEGFKEKISYYFRANGQLVYKEVFFYLCETSEEKVVLSNEHIGYEWMEYDPAMKKLTYKNAKEILKKADKFLKNEKP